MIYRPSVPVECVESVSVMLFVAYLDFDVSEITIFFILFFFLIAILRFCKSVKVMVTELMTTKPLMFNEAAVHNSPAVTPCPLHNGR